MSPPLAPPGLVVLPLPAPRPCWVLAYFVDEHVWEVDTFEAREALAVAIPAPAWDGRQWAPTMEHAAMILTWAPTGFGGFLWIPERSLYWSEEAARQGALRHTREEREQLRAQRREARRATREQAREQARKGPGKAESP